MTETHVPGATDAKLGPRIGPRAPDHLIIMLTGARQLADDLLPVADALVTRIPRAAAVIVSPPAGMGGEWFMEAGADADGPAVAAALARLWPRILKAAEAEGVSVDRLSVFGFGQGATLAMAAAAAGHPFVCVLALAGRLVGDLKARRAHAPDLFISYGEQDDITAPIEGQHAAEAFARRGYSVALIPASDLGHAIGSVQLHDGASFLRGAIVERASLAQTGPTG